MATIEHYSENWPARSVTQRGKTTLYKINSTSIAMISLIIANLIGVVVFLLIFLLF